jgi:co-chaperonin GroES (HSP10)
MSKTQVFPVLDNILIKPFPGEEMSEGGIIVADSYKPRNNKATVIAVGSGTKKRPMKFIPGMVVHSIKESGEELIIDGEKYYLVKDSWLLASEN